MSILAFLAIALLAVISPGPDSVLIARNSVSFSRRAGWFTALGIAIGNMVHVAYSLVGIGMLIANSIVLFNTIKTLGAFYLLYIGAMALRAKPASSKTNADMPAPTRTMSDRQAFRMGFLCNVLNPKCTLFFLALFTQLIDTSTPLASKALYGLSMVAIAFGWFSILATLLSHHAVKSRFEKVSHHVERAMGAVLIALGIKVLISKRA